MIRAFLHFSTVPNLHIPTELEISYGMEDFVMGHTSTWMPFVGEKLDTAMQLNNYKGNYVVAIFQEGKKKVIGRLPLGKF